MSRFIKEVENVTGQMGSGEVVASAEEVVSDTAAPMAGPDPWAALLHVGVQLVSALAASADCCEHVASLG